MLNVKTNSGCFGGVPEGLMSEVFHLSAAYLLAPVAVWRLNYLHKAENHVQESYKTLIS